MGIRIRKIRHQSNPKINTTSSFTKCHECGELVSKSELFDSKYCENCYNTIKLARKKSLNRCGNCHEYFDPSRSADPHHCPECVKKMRRCRNCHTEFIPQGKILLCPICYSEKVKTCEVCKKDFLPTSKKRNICPRCDKKDSYSKISQISSKAKDQINHESEDRTFKLLIKALDDPNTCESATEKLLESGDKFVPYLIQSLNIQNHGKRNVLVKILVEYGDTAVNPLIESLDDDDYLVRKNCVKALGQIGDERAVEPIINTLDDINDSVRKSSVKALGLVGDQKAIDPLIELLESDFSSIVKIATVKALKTFGNEKVIKALIEALDDEDTKVFITILKTLTEIDEEDGLQYLIKNLNHPKSKIADFSASLIIKLKGETFLDDIKQNQDRNRLSKDEFLKLIEELSSKDPDIKIESVRKLGNSGNQNAAKYLNDLIDDDNKNVRLEVITSLGKLKNLDSINILIKSLLDEDPSVGWSAEEAIAKFGVSAIPFISKYLKTDNEGLRYYLVRILGEFEDVKSEQLLIKALFDEDDDVKIMAIESLDKVGTEICTDYLIMLLDDDNENVRRITKNVLEQLCGEKDLENLVNILMNNFDGKNKSLESLIKKIKARVEKKTTEETINYNIKVENSKAEDESFDITSNDVNTDNSEEDLFKIIEDYDNKHL